MGKLVIFGFLLLCLDVLGQTPTNLLHIHGSEGEDIRDLEIDEEGYMYAGGYFDEGIDLDPGVDEEFHYSGYDAKAYLIKLTPSGNYEWGFILDGGIFEETLILEVELDESGYVYVSGSFDGGIDFDPGPDAWFLSSGASSARFIAKYSPDGDLVWAYKFDCVLTDFVVGSDYRIYTSGYYFDSVDVDPGLGEVYEFSDGGSDVFLAVLDTAANLLDHKSLKSSEDVKSGELHVDSEGNIYLNGTFGGDSLDIDVGPGENYIDYDDGFGFVLKLSSTGDFLWVRQFNSYLQFAEDDVGDLIISGRFYEVRDFDFGPGIDTLNVNDHGGHFIQKIDSDGNHLWVVSLGKQGDPDPSFGITALHTDEAGHIYTCGSFNEPMNLDPESYTFDYIPNEYIEDYPLNTTDMFVAKYSSTGELIYGNVIGGNSYDFAMKCIFFNNELVLTGEFRDDVDFDLSESTMIINPDHIDVFIASYDLCIVSADFSELDGTYTADLDDVGYQWLDCNDDFSEIIGETNQSFTPVDNGEYALEVTRGICKDTSECFSVLDIGINKENVNSLNVYPNPSEGNFAVSTNSNSFITEYNIVDQLGKTILTKKNIASSQVSINMGEYKPGVYVLIVTLDSGEKLRLKLIFS